MNPYSPVPVSPIVPQASPYPTATPGPYPQTSPSQAATIQPGSITYTTTVGPDGQIVYHPFKCVPRVCLSLDHPIAHPDRLPLAPQSCSSQVCVLLLSSMSSDRDPLARSYQTAQGIVSGIQWIPAEATSVLPANATPADSVRSRFFSFRVRAYGLTRSP